MNRFLRNPETPPLPVMVAAPTLIVFSFRSRWSAKGKNGLFRSFPPRDTRLIRADRSPFAAALNLHEPRAAASWRNWRDFAFNRLEYGRAAGRGEGVDIRDESIRGIKID